jgi:sec-independent protein translocase protein TatB
MFDIGFSELLVIAIVALIVVGPERLPKVARTLGHLMGRMQRFVAEVKADINNQLKLEELRKIEAEMRAKAQSAEHVITEEARSAASQFQATADAVNSSGAAALPPEKAGQPPPEAQRPAGDRQGPAEPGPKHSPGKPV